MLTEFLKDVIKKSDKRAVEIVSTEFFSDYEWRSKDERVTLPAYAFVTESRGRKHNVVLTYKDDEFYMWCGDKWLREEKKMEEEYCKGWKWRDGEKYCHHCNAVAYHLLGNEKLLKKAEKNLKKAKDEKNETEKSLVLSEIEIAYEEKLSLLLYGVTGSGKTHRVLEFVSTLTDVEFFQINMSSGLEDIDLLAKMIPDPESGKWQIKDGELWRAFLTAVEKPVVVLIEELTRASKSARNLLLKAMDSVAGKYILQNFVIGETVEVPTENVWWVATANIGYSDTEELDPALMRRFLITKFVDYDVEKEKEILSEFLSGDEVKKTLKMVKALRRAYTSGQVAYPVDTGTLKTFAKILAKIKDPMKTAEMTFLYRIVDVDGAGYPSEEQIELVRRVVKESFKL